jgi:hypothetical protein
VTLGDCCEDICDFCPELSHCTPPKEICDDGLDNDGNGLTDCDDLDCKEAPACLGENCEAPLPLIPGGMAVPADGGVFNVSGTTAGRSNTYGLTCLRKDGGTADGIGQDVVYSFTLTDTLWARFEMDFTATFNWPGLFLVGPGCDADSLLACHWTKSDGGPAFIPDMELVSGTYFLIVDAVYSSDNGPFSLMATFFALTANETNCTDGVDNDGDGLKDCCDDDCSLDAVCLAETNCTDGVDNDCDGFADCNDSDCQALPACQGDSCEVALPVSAESLTVADDGAVFNLTGNTSLKSNIYGGSCSTPSAGAKDEVWLLKLADTLKVTVTMDFAATFNYPALYIFTGCEPEAEIACGKSTGAPVVLSEILPPGSYYIVADGNWSSDAGEYTLDILVEVPPTAETVCDDGIDDDGDGLTDCCDEDCFLDDFCLAETICGDGKDNDCDDKVDCDDSDCDADAACMIDALPFFEDVEHVGAPPPGWFTETPASSCTWSIVDTGADGTEYSAMHAYSWDCDEEPSLLVSPQIDVAGCGTLSVTFWEKGTWQDDRWYHGVGAWDGTTMVHVEHNQDAPADFQEIATPILIDVTGLESPVRFFFAYAGSNADDWWVDQLSITCGD